MLNNLVYEIRPDGDLMWYRHVGREDGTFRWQGPKSVGRGWGELEHVFSDEDGVVYGVEPMVQANVQIKGRTPRPAGGGLMWYRHIGREDGTFRWEGPKKVGKGWGGLTHVFSGGGGVIYGIQENGDLMWYRHLGREDGSFRWEGPKKVGTGWGGFNHVFSGGDGVIYGVQSITQANVKVVGTTPRPSGGDLMWYRHVGREDGSFQWEGPKKVGTGWGELTHVFSGGDGVIYGVEPVVQSSVQVFGKTPGPSGGNLMWYRHVGWENGGFGWEGPKKVGSGWGSVKRLFSGGDVLSLAEAEQEILQFHSNTIAVLSVGSPVEPVRRITHGGFEQRCNFGSIIKPQGEPPELGKRFHVTIQLAGVRCFATDDPSGTDEPYLITTVYALDRSAPDKNVQTENIGPDSIGSVEATNSDQPPQSNSVFAKGGTLATDFLVPGDGEIRIHVQLWDQESVGTYADVKKTTGDLAKAAMAAGLASLGLAGAAGAAGGIMNSVASAFGGFVAGIFADNLLGEMDFIVPNSFLQTLRDAPASLNRWSDAIPGEMFNYPNRPEDASWLFDRDGLGTYRPFFRITLV